MLRDHLGSLGGEEGSALYDVRVREWGLNADGGDPVLRNLDTSEFDELWLFAVETGYGLSENDCAAITRFRQGGGGVLTAHDSPPGDCPND